MVTPLLCHTGALSREKTQLVRVAFAQLLTRPPITVQWSMVRPPVVNAPMGWWVPLP